MYNYKAAVIGDGTGENPYRPDIPENVNWVGQIEEGFYYIKTDVVVEGLEEATIAGSEEWAINGQS